MACAPTSTPCLFFILFCFRSIWSNFTESSRISLTQVVQFCPARCLARTFFTSQAWSVLPCVRPLGAVHMTAGHNALRGSGPGQKRAFDDAMARVGCPDRRIDRL